MQQKKLSRLCILFVLLAILASCSQPAPVPTSTKDVAVIIHTTAAPTSTPGILHTAPVRSVIPLPTFTRSATNTRTPTLTFTPKLTISPFSTYNPSQVVVRTPEIAVCPPVVPGVIVDLEVTELNPFEDYPNEALRNLALGADPKDVVTALNQMDLDRMDPPRSELRDLTGDRIPEITISIGFYFYVLGCDHGEYRELLAYSNILTFTDIEVIEVVDLNRNGIPEVLTTNVIASASIQEYDIFEWDGEQFNQLLQYSYGDFAYRAFPFLKPLYWYDMIHGDGVPEGFSEYSFQDIDSNGTLELILYDHGPMTKYTLCDYFGTWRGKKMTYTWDGLYFIFSSVEMDPPTFRFEAVQDADHEFLFGDYPEALSLYQDVIFSDKLLSWSEDAYDYLWDRYDCGFDNPNPGPPPYNDEEYQQLAAYARYRIILHHLAQGWEHDAETVLTTFRETTPTGSPGYPYLEMAELLWANYQESKNLEQACVPVVQYAAGSEEILTILNGANGSQNHGYAPEDVCPFP